MPALDKHTLSFHPIKKQPMIIRAVARSFVSVVQDAIADFHVINKLEKVQAGFLPPRKAPPIVRTVMHWYFVLPMGSARNPPTICPVLIIMEGAQLNQPAYMEAPPLSVYMIATIPGQRIAMA
jgi:hypothetical protein